MSIHVENMKGYSYPKTFAYESCKCEVWLPNLRTKTQHCPDCGSFFSPSAGHVFARQGSQDKLLNAKMQEMGLFYGFCDD